MKHTTKSIKADLEGARLSGRNLYYDIRLDDGDTFTYRIIDAKTVRGIPMIRTLTSWRRVSPDGTFDIR